METWKNRLLLFHRLIRLPLTVNRLDSQCFIIHILSCSASLQLFILWPRLFIMLSSIIWNYSSLCVVYWGQSKFWNMFRFFKMPGISFCIQWGCSSMSTATNTVSYQPYKHHQYHSYLLLFFQICQPHLWSCWWGNYLDNLWIQLGSYSKWC